MSLDLFLEVLLRVLGHGLPVQLLTSCEPLPPHKHNVNNALGVTQKDKCRLDRQCSLCLLGKLDKQLIAQECQVAKHNDSDDLIAHCEACVAPHHHQAPDRHADD